MLGRWYNGPRVKTRKGDRCSRLHLCFFFLFFLNHLITHSSTIKKTKHLIFAFWSAVDS